MDVFIIRITKKFENKFGIHGYGDIVITRNEAIANDILRNGYSESYQIKNLNDFKNYDVPMSEIKKLGVFP